MDATAIYVIAIVLGSTLFGLLINFAALTELKTEVRRLKQELQSDQWN